MQPVSICVLTYGDYLSLARRCIESILQYFPRQQYKLLVGANAPAPATVDYLQELKARGAVDELIISEQNLNKCPMMRRLFELVDTEFVWWFDDDTWIKSPETFDRWLQAARNAPSVTAMWGHVFWCSNESDFSQGHDMAEWVRAAPWFGGKEPPSWNPGGKGVVEFKGGFGGDGSWHFAVGGSWLLRKSAIDILDWPDKRLTMAAEDVLLGEAIRQQGWRIQDMGSDGIAISDGDRRGKGEGRDMDRQVKKSPPQRVTADESPFDASQPVVTFQIAASNESVEQIEWCLFHLRESYPDNLVTMVSDLEGSPDIERVAETYRARLRRREKARNGLPESSWWRHFFQEAMETPFDHVARVDPHTCIRRRFFIPNGADFFGAVCHPGTREEHVRGSCQVFSRRFAESYLRLASTSRSSVERESNSGRKMKHVPVAGSVFSRIDAAIMQAARDLQIPWLHHPEFAEAATPGGRYDEAGRLAITHPHRILPPTRSIRFAPIDVALINRRRPENIRRIIHALLPQRRHCTITLIETSANTEFGVDATTLGLADRHFIFSHGQETLTRFALSLSSPAEFTLFHDDDVLPGRRAMASLLDAARQIQTFSALGELGLRLGRDGELIENVEPIAGEVQRVDFLAGSYLVRTENLYCLWDAVSEMDLRCDETEDSLLPCAAIQLKTGFPCLVLPARAPDEALISARLPAPFARIRDEEGRAKRIQRLRSTGWNPICAQAAPAAAFEEKVKDPLASR